MRPEEPGSTRPLVECPGCHYHPTELDIWVCWPDGCGYQWDTFATAGQCPGCGARFPWTACPACGQLFAHRAWYVRQG